MSSLSWNHFYSEMCKDVLLLHPSSRLLGFCNLDADSMSWKWLGGLCAPRRSSWRSFTGFRLETVCARSSGVSFMVGVRDQSQKSFKSLNHQYLIPLYTLPPPMRFLHQRLSLFVFPFSRFSRVLTLNAHSSDSPKAMTHIHLCPTARTHQLWWFTALLAKSYWTVSHFLDRSGNWNDPAGYRTHNTYTLHCTSVGQIPLRHRWNHIIVALYACPLLL